MQFQIRTIVFVLFFHSVYNAGELILSPNCDNTTYEIAWDATVCSCPHGEYASPPMTFTNNYIVFTVQTNAKAHLRLSHWMDNFDGPSFWEFIFDSKQTYKLRIRNGTVTTDLSTYSGGHDIHYDEGYDFWIYWDMTANISLGSGSEILKNTYVSTNYFQQYSNLSIEYLYVAAFKNDIVVHFWDLCGTMHPSTVPTIEPTMEPTIGPTINPTMNPTGKELANPEPTMEPTVEPTGEIIIIEKETVKDMTQFYTILFSAISVFLLIIILAAIYGYRRYAKLKASYNITLGTLNSASSNSYTSRTITRRAIELQTNTSNVSRCTPPIAFGLPYHDEPDEIEGGTAPNICPGAVTVTDTKGVIEKQDEEKQDETVNETVNEMVNGWNMKPIQETRGTIDLGEV